MSEQTERFVAGRQWFREAYPRLADGKTRVSRYYPRGMHGTWSREHATWAFEFPLKDLESAVSVTYCVCESESGDGFVYCLRVPHRYVLTHRNRLYERIDKGGRLSISVFLAADSNIELREVRGLGKIDFRQFLLAP
jgi:hypothetical protein